MGTQSHKITNPVDGNYKVIVHRWTDDEGTVSQAWTLYRRGKEKWLECRRDQPADEAIFNLADQVIWSGVAPGEYSLTGSRLDSA
jgi:hypothetical protein